MRFYPDEKMWAERGRQGGAAWRTGLSAPRSFTLVMDNNWSNQLFDDIIIIISLLILLLFFY